MNPKIKPGSSSRLDLRSGPRLYYLSDSAIFFAVGTTPSFPSKPAYALLMKLKELFRDQDLCSVAPSHLLADLPAIRSLFSKYADRSQWDASTVKRAGRYEEAQEERAILLEELRQKSSWRSWLSRPSPVTATQAKVGGCCCCAVLVALGITALCIYLKIMSGGLL